MNTPHASSYSMHFDHESSAIELSAVHFASHSRLDRWHNTWTVYIWHVEKACAK